MPAHPSSLLPASPLQTLLDTIRTTARSQADTGAAFVMPPKP